MERKKVSGKRRAYKEVVVTWVDSMTSGGWFSPKAVKVFSGEDASCITRGYEVARNKDYLVVAQSVSDTTNEVSNLIMIPRVCIRRLRCQKS